MRPFRFIHSADLHLDSPFVGLRKLNGEVAAELRRASFDAFENLVNLCIDKAADFLVVAGDVYDGADRSLMAQLKFRGGLQRLSDAGIHSYVVHGNHDPLDGWAASLSRPDLMHSFGPPPGEILYHKKDGEKIAAIQGMSFPKRDVKSNLARRFISAQKAPFHIGLLHCNAGADTGHEPYAPCTILDLKKENVDYWALGHVHQRRELSPQHPAIVYSGNIQGRHIGEAGPRGCYLVEVDSSGDVRFEFHPLDAVRFAALEVPIDSLDTEQALLDELQGQIRVKLEEAQGRHLVLRITLSGRGPLHRVLQENTHLKEILEIIREAGLEESPFAWIDRIQLATGLPIDIEARRSSPDLVGEMLRLIEDYRKGKRDVKELRKDLGPLMDHAKNRKGRGEKYIVLPGEEELLEYLEGAETLLLDLWAEE
jgi:exonuclease SbcD